MRNLRVGLLALFVAGLALLTANHGVGAPPTKEEIQKARDAIEEMVKTAGKGADKVAASNEIAAVMQAFKPEAKGGIMAGQGIELKVMALAKKTVPADQLAKESADLIKMAQHTKAIGDINHYYAPKDKKPKMDPKDWVKYNDDMKKFSLELVEVLKKPKADPAEVKKVSNSLNSSCVNCHTTFRDAE